MNSMQMGLFKQPPPPQPKAEPEKEGEPAPESTQQSHPVPVPANAPAPPPKRVLENLGHFCGTTTWYRLNRYVFPGWLLTDGTQYLSEEYGAGWLMDVIASHNKRTPKVSKHPFQVWKLTVQEDASWEIVATNGNEKEIARQSDVYTDFPEDITLYACFSGEDTWVILLPGEY